MWKIRLAISSTTWRCTRRPTRTIYVIDVPVILVPVLLKAWPRREIGKALMSLPAFFVLRVVNGLLFLEAMWKELVLRQSLRVYEKGH